MQVLNNVVNEEVMSNEVMSNEVMSNEVMPSINDESTWNLADDFDADLDEDDIIEEAKDIPQTPDFSMFKTPTQEEIEAEEEKEATQSIPDNLDLNALLSAFNAIPHTQKIRTTSTRASKILPLYGINQTRVLQNNLETIPLSEDLMLKEFAYAVWAGRITSVLVKETDGDIIGDTLAKNSFPQGARKTTIMRNLTELLFKRRLAESGFVTIPYKYWDNISNEYQGGFILHITNQFSKRGDDRRYMNILLEFLMTKISKYEAKQKRVDFPIVALKDLCPVPMTPTLLDDGLTLYRVEA